MTWRGWERSTASKSARIGPSWIGTVSIRRFALSRIWNSPWSRLGVMVASIPCSLYSTRTWGREGLDLLSRNGVTEVGETPGGVTTSAKPDSGSVTRPKLKCPSESLRVWPIGSGALDSTIRHNSSLRGPAGSWPCRGTVAWLALMRASCNRGQSHEPGSSSRLPGWTAEGRGGTSG